MTNIVRPADLEPLKKPLVEAVIDAWMRTYTEGTGGLPGDSGSCADGEFRFSFPETLDWDPGFYVSYPDGQWKKDVRAGWDPEVDPGAGLEAYGASTFDAPALWRRIEEMVSAWLDPWIHDCPDPGSFDNQISRLADVVDQLYVDDEVRIGEVRVLPADVKAPTTAMTSPVTDVQDGIAKMRDYLGDVSSRAIDALEDAYCSDVALTLSGQRALAIVAGLAVAGEAEAWATTYRNLKTLIEAAITDFSSYAQAREASGRGATVTLTALAGLATLGSAASGPAAAGFVAAAGVLTVASALWPTNDERSPTDITLSGGDFPSYFRSFTDAMTKVAVDLRHAERDLGLFCERALADYRAAPANYSITTHGGGPQHPDEDLDLFLGREISVAPYKVRKVGGIIESIGDHQRAVAGMLGGPGTASRLVEHEWTRGSLAGATIGAGDHGHYAAYARVVDTLVDLLLREGRTAHRIAEHCLRIASDFEATDAEVAAALDRMAARYDLVSVPQMTALR